jgi:hypothetical protein
MKKSNHYLVLLAGALGVAGVMTFSTKLALAAPGGGTNAPAATAPAGAKVKPDLLTTCPVSGEKLGEMGKPFVFTNSLQEVKLCCPNCKADFEKEPAKYLAKIRAADKK